MNTLILLPGRNRLHSEATKLWFVGMANSSVAFGRPVDARPTEEVYRYRLICGPALAEVVGDRRP